MTRTNANIVDKYRFLLPPLEEQRRIVEKLEALFSELDSAVQSLEAALAKLKRYRQAVLKAAVEGELSREWREANQMETPWPVFPLRDVASSRLGKMLDKAKNQGNLTPYLRNVNVRWFSFDLSDILEIRVTQREAAELAVQPNDVLICEGGEPGRCAVWCGASGIFVYQKALHRVRTSDALLPDWLCFCLRHAADSGVLERLFTGTTIKHLTGQSLSRFMLSLPSPEEQRFIVQEVDRLLSEADKTEETIRASLKRAARLQQAVLKEAFSGRLVPQDPSGEPAAVLLERIRAARQAEAGKKGSGKRKAQPLLL